MNIKKELAKALLDLVGLLLLVYLKHLIVLIVVVGLLWFLFKH